MSLSYTRAPTVAKGQKITSTQYRLLALAFNDRFRNGPGDPAWRLSMLHFNLWRQVRNPDSSGMLFPPQGEAFDIYQLLEPEYNPGLTWPEAGPGEPEGANLASPMMQFTFGNPQLDSEDIRLSSKVPLWFSDGFNETVPSTEADFWQLGKFQRGAYDPINGAQFVPAFDAAQSIFQFAFPPWSPMGKSYGGWQPIPTELTADCGAGNPDDIGANIPSWQIFFTGTRPDVSTAGFHGTPGVNADGLPTITYNGTCPCGSALFGTGHVLYLLELPFAFYVYVATGSGDCSVYVDRFDYKDWIQGPYTSGARLNHTEGKQLQRAVHSFITDYRGTPEQRSPDTFKIQQIAFDYQEFFNRQYYLAPNKGVVSGDSLQPLYPSVTFAGEKVNAGLGTFSGEGTGHTYTDGFVFAGAFAQATKLFNPVSINLLNDTAVIATLSLIPDKDGNASATVWLKSALKPAPLRIHLNEQAAFVGSGSITVECNELLEYKPEYWDAYLISRMESTFGMDAFLGGGNDGRGKDTANAKELSDDYFQFGCIVNTHADRVRDIADWINDTPVYDTARRLTKSHLRIIRRQQLLSYEVTGGVSIIRMKRFAFGLSNTKVDLLDGIAPSFNPVSTGQLVKGETYIVRGGSNHNTNRIVYLGGAYSDGQKFTAATEQHFETHGDALVYVYEGISHSALEKGQTNEWVSFLQTKCYHANPTSNFKPEVYSDYFTFCNRCHFYSRTGVAELRRFVNYNYSAQLDPDTNLPQLQPIRVQPVFLSPEAPTGYNYTLQSNTLYGGDHFYKSCQIYEAPVELQSCIVEDQTNGICKLTFKTRFKSHPNAPVSVDKNPLNWSAGEINNLRNVLDDGTQEDWRTPDNAMREYFLSDVNGNYPCTFKTGDAGSGVTNSMIEDNLSGSCYPHLFLVKLIPLPYEESPPNDTQQLHDTRATVDAFQQMEIYLRAMCEGFVDGVTSQALVCKYHAMGLTTMFDYSFENLCFQAFQGKWIGAFSLNARDDNPSGFGPLPNTLMYADVFNRLSSAVNLLDKARIDLPIQGLYHNTDYSGASGPVAATLCSNTVACSRTGSLSFAYLDGGSFFTRENPIVGPDIAGTVFGASASCNLDGCPFFLNGTSSDVTFKLQVDPAFINAVPAELQDLLNQGYGGFIAQIDYTQTTDHRNVTTTPGAGDGCYPPGSTDQWFDSANNANKFFWNTPVNFHYSECRLLTGGTFSPPGLLSCDYKFGNVPAGPAFCHNGPQSSVQFTLLNDQGAFCQVPIVDGV